MADAGSMQGYVDAALRERDWVEVVLTHAYR